MSKAPEPVPQSTIIALQAWQDKSKINNANWENKMNEAVTVNPADSINVTACFIDTRGTASGNIDLAVDTEISLEYYFYWIHSFNACDASGLIQSPVTPDASNNLNQQVLVGGPINYLMGNQLPNVPSYNTSNVNAFSATNINDADGLPYLVMQSTNTFPVPAIIGLTLDAVYIVVGEIYLVAIEGLTINWAYAGIAGANYNKLPAGWVLKTSFFTATNNPYNNLPTSAFIPAGLASPLPYITYIITNVGATDWVAIDPGLASNIIPATQMVNGGRYSIASVGTFDFTYWGADENQVGLVFTATIPPVLPMVFPVTIPTSVFLANVATWYVPGGSPTFGADPTDQFQVVLNMDPVTGDITASSLFGTGAWLRVNDSAPGPGWIIPKSYFGFSAGTPNATDVGIGDFNIEISGLSVHDLNIGTTYKVLATGSEDGSDPQFTWNMVGNFPTAQTTALSPDVYYQIIAPLTGVDIATLNDGGVVSEIFLCQQGNILSQVITLDTSTDPPISVCTLTDQTGFDYMPTLVSNYEAGVNIEVVYTNNVGVWYYFPYQDPGNYQSVLGTGPHSGSPFSDQATPASQLTLTIPPKNIGATAQTQFFSVWDGNPSVDGGFDYGNVWTMDPLNPPPQPQQLIIFNGVGQVFTATGIYTGEGTIATVESYTTSTAVVSGTGYVYGQVEASVIEVGTVVHAINPDPGLPNDNGGRASVDPYQYNSTIYQQYDGYVAEYTPPSTRLDIRPVKKRWSMTIPRGSYNPNYLAELISRNMSRQKIKRVNNVQGGPFGTQSTLNVPTDSIYNNVPTTNVWANPNGRGSNTFYDSKNPKVYDYPSELDYNLLPDNADDMPFLFCPAMNSSMLNNDPADASMNYIYAEIPHPNANGLNNLPTPTYYVNLVPLCSDVFSVSPTLKTIQVDQFDGLYSILPFYSQNALVTGASPYTGNSGIFPIVFGANQTSLLYNNENNGLFSFNYLHSPIYAFLSSNTTQLSECTAHMYTTQKVSTNMNGSNYFTTLVDKKSGILLNKMEPASFWGQLGFDIPALTVDLDKDPNGYGNYMTLREFQAKTTGGFCGSSNIFNPTFHTANSADQPCVPDTELLYLTAVPSAIPHPVNIIPFTNQAPVMIAGQQYVINSLGWFSPVNDYQLYQAVDWSYVATAVNPNDDITNAYVGMPIVATNNWDGVHYLPYFVEAFWFVNDQSQRPLPSVYSDAVPITTSTQLQNTYFQVENTNTLNASIIPTVRDSTGHFLVELTAYNSNFINDKSKYEVKAIVSTYWLSPGAFVSSPFPSSYNFFGTGSPLTLSNIKVRILDPYTMSEAIIGPNSSIYLQVNKMLSEQAVQQIPN